ncbi:MAG: preprotein translocase subunit SecE [Clostridia bacterium]|nr:preprotein translocase subunit SecE [Clostridia bacterium]
MAENTNKKPNIFSRMGKFFKDCRSEFKKLVWPSKQQLFKNSSLVIVTMIVVGAVLSLVDFGLSEGLYLLKDLIEFIKPVG